MLEPREYTPRELLAWSRFSGLSLLGLALAYIRERDGAVDGFVSFAGERLAEAWGGFGAGDVESAMLGLLLSAEALGAEVRSRAMNPEEAEAVVSNLPGPQMCQDLEDRFDVQVTPEDILALAGVSQDEMNRLFDILGAAAAAGGFEFRREPEGEDAQRLVVRAW